MANSSFKTIIFINCEGHNKQEAIVVFGYSEYLITIFLIIIR
jgi:hypothetical protein